MRVLAITAGIVNLTCMFLAAITADGETFLYAWLGASFAGYAYLRFVEEARAMGEHHIGYRSLAMRLRWEIKEESSMTPGKRLPSIKQLAEDHEATRTTVRRALTILAEEGLVDIVHGRGVYITGDGCRDRPRDLIEWELTILVADLDPGYALPRTRELMNRYGVSHPTVRRVQIELAQRGLIRRTRTGRYVVA